MPRQPQLKTASAWFGMTSAFDSKTGKPILPKKVTPPTPKKATQDPITEFTQTQKPKKTFISPQLECFLKQLNAKDEEVDDFEMPSFEIAPKRKEPVIPSTIYGSSYEIPKIDIPEEEEEDDFEMPSWNISPVRKPTSDYYGIEFSQEIQTGKRKDTGFDMPVPKAKRPFAY